MSVRARYLVVITSLITIVVLVLAYFQCARLMSAHLTAKVAAENMVATNVLALAQKAVNERPQMSAESAIKDDLQVRGWLDAVGRNGHFSYFGILGADSNVLIEHDPLHHRNNSIVIPFETLHHKSWIRQWLDLRHSNYLYEISTPLNVNSQPFGRFVAGVPAQTIYNEVLPDLRLALSIAMVAGLLAVLLAVLFSNLVLRPLREFFGLIEQLEVESAAQSADEKESSGQDLQWAAQRLRELGKRFAGNRNEIEAMRDQMRQVMSNFPDRLLLLDRDQRVMMASPEAERLLLSWESANSKIASNGNGHPQSLRGLILSDVLTDAHPLSLLTRRAFNSGQLREETMTLPTPEEKEHKLLASVQVFEEHGQLAGALLTLRDFESLKRLETQLDYATRLAALSRITSGVAHEVKNPLHAMVLHLELMRAKIDAGRDPSNHVEVLTSEVNRLNRVVQTFLDFTRPVQLQTRRYDANELMREVMMLTPITPESKIEVITSYASEPLFIETDIDLLKQGLLNISINACQAMPEGGTLTITTASHNNQVEITISDTGIGIPEDMREKIFNLYFTTKEKGSGIGLAQAFRAVQMHSGNIEVESEVGKGTRFKICLPAV
ncbi:MAG: PAS domain-containing protein [Acidobacteria bacterium]|nr:PAS domain-containing protein [Acidobacteriota bacterium]